MRPPYFALRLPGPRKCDRDPDTGLMLPDEPPIVLGRKFCSGCGRWRHVCDFGWFKRKGVYSIRSRCQVCHRRSSRRYWHEMMRDQERADRMREYGRIYAEGQRRARGVPRRNFHNRRTVVDKLEYAFLPREPLVVRIELEGITEHELAKVSDVPEKSIRRLLTGESAHVRIDLADKLCLGLGTSLWTVFGDTPLLRYGDLQPESEVQG